MASCNSVTYKAVHFFYCWNFDILQNILVAMKWLQLSSNFVWLCLYYWHRWQPCNFKSRVEESTEACEKFEEKITLVLDFGRGSKLIFLVCLSHLGWDTFSSLTLVFTVLESKIFIHIGLASRSSCQFQSNWMIVT